MILYGRNPVREALRGSRAVKGIWATKRAQDAEEWLHGSELRTVDGGEVERLCGSPEHQGVCAEVSDYRYADPGGLLADEDALVICLDEVQDPHNLGAVCRVAESAGAAGVVIPERRSAEITPAAAKASAGAVEHLPVARVGNLANWLGEAKQAGAWVYGAEAGPQAAPYHTLDYSGRVVLVLGSEGRGLRPRVADSCDQLVALPQRGRVNSLNVSTAAAALMYGILHLRESGLDKAP
ncbi:MAG TPA: 23S rRNA (guanosine(2251)-2'-O)-methyltransferase RlmB [Thermoleophilaceae bacterium]|nr:23S rRNA (guanosine(2251)-2'-O)-methyltransferase RlmB [Thermoleophilaceae bacterium]